MSDVLAQYGKIRYNSGQTERDLIKGNDLLRELGAPLFMNHNRRRTVQNVYGSVPFCVDNDVVSSRGSFPPTRLYANKQEYNCRLFESFCEGDYIW